MNIVVCVHTHTWEILYLAPTLSCTYYLQYGCNAQNSHRNCEENSKKFSVKNFPTYAFHKTFSFPEKQNKFSRMSKLSTKYNLYKLVLLPDQPSFFLGGGEGRGKGCYYCRRPEPKRHNPSIIKHRVGEPVPAVFHQLSETTEDVKDKHFK